MAAYETLIKFLELNQSLEKIDALIRLSGKDLTEAIMALKALVNSYNVDDNETDLANNNSREINLKDLANNNFWEGTSFWKKHGVDFKLENFNGPITTDDAKTSALQNINNKAKKLLEALETHDNRLKQINEISENLKGQDKLAAEKNEQIITDVLERNSIDLYHSIHNNKAQALIEETNSQKLLRKVNSALGNLKPISTQLDEEIRYLLNINKTSEINELISDLTISNKKIKHNIDQYEATVKKIENKEDGLLKTIDDAQKLDYIFLGNGVTYTIRKKESDEVYTPIYKGNGRTLVNHTSLNTEKLQYAPVDKRAAFEEAVFEKAYNPSGKSIFVLRGEGKELEWESEKFPKTDADRQDHAFRWAMEIVRNRPRSPCTPIYLVEGSKNPEEIKYLGNALQTVLKWEEEKILKYNPDAKIDDNHHKIVTDSKTWKPSSWLGRGMSSFYNTIVNDSAVEQFKKEFQYAKDDIAFTKLAGVSQPIDEKIKEYRKKSFDGRQSSADSKASGSNNPENVLELEKEVGLGKREKVNVNTPLQIPPVPKRTSSKVDEKVDEKVEKNLPTTTTTTTTTITQTDDTKANNSRGPNI